MLGMATGGWIGGVLFGFYDHYLLTIALSVATSLAGASVIMSMDQTDRVLILDWEEGLSRGNVDTGPRRRLDIRPLLVPPGVLLVGVGRLNHAWFVEGFTRYLHAHRQPRLGETAWH